MSLFEHAVLWAGVAMIVAFLLELGRRIARRKPSAECERSNPRLTHDERDAIPPDLNCPDCVAEQAMKKGRLDRAHRLMATMRRPE